MIFRRHVFKLHVRVPIGHHLEILSNSPFTLTNEDSVFAFLDQVRAPIIITKQVL